MVSDAATLRKWLIFWSFSATAACASPPPKSPGDDPAAHIKGGGRVDPANATEERLLTKLGTLPTGSAVIVDQLSVVAEAPYSSASGRLCRRLVITERSGSKNSHTRLACRDDKVWFFAPEVFLTPAE